MAINSGWLDQMKSMADISKFLDSADKKYDSIEESAKNTAKYNRDAARAAAGDSGATTANTSGGSVMNSPGMPQHGFMGTPPPTTGGGTGANGQPLHPQIKINPGSVQTGSGWEKSPFADVGQFPIIGGLLGKLVEPAKMAYQAMPTVQESFDYEYMRNRAAFAGMGGMTGSRQDQEEVVRRLGKTTGQNGIVNSPLDAYEALNNSRNLGSNTGAISSSLATATNLSPGIGMTAAAGALTSLNSARSVNMLRMIGVNIRDASTGNMRELNKIIEDLWATLNKQKRGGGAITKDDIRLSLQPGNALDSLLEQYFSGDPLTRKIIEDGLFAKASGVTDLTDQQQMVDKGVIPDAIRSKSKRDVASSGVIATFTDAIIQGFETANAVARALSGTIEKLFNLPGFSQFANLFAGMKGFLDTGVSIGNGVGGTIIDKLSGIPGLAEGGPTEARNMYLVGEKGPELYVPRTGQQRVVGQGGPELFVPEVDGQIIPNHKLNFAGGMHTGGAVTTKSRSDGSHSHPEKDHGNWHKHGSSVGNTKEQIPHEKLRGILKQAGWRTDEDIENAIKIISLESGRRPLAENFEGADMSYGLFQINMKNDVPGNQGMGNRRRAKYAKYGVVNDWDLFDPIKNAQVAWEVSSEGRQFKGWSTAAAAGLTGPFGNPRGKNKGVVGAVEGWWNKGTDAVSSATNWVADKASGIFNKITDVASVADGLKAFLSALTTEFPNQLKLAGVREAGGPVTTNGVSGSGAYNINYGGITINVTGSANWDEKKLAQEIKKSLDYDNLIRKAAHH
jgi:hypothetical protein